MSKLNDAEAEAAETQTWVAFAVECKYLDAVVGRELSGVYDNILGKLVKELPILYCEQLIMIQV